MTTLTIERAATLPLPIVDRVQVLALLWRVMRFALVAYCLLGLVSYAPTLDAKGRCDCPFFELF